MHLLDLPIEIIDKIFGLINSPLEVPTQSRRLNPALHLPLICHDLHRSGQMALWSNVDINIYGPIELQQSRNKQDSLPALLRNCSLISSIGDTPSNCEFVKSFIIYSFDYRKPSLASKDPQLEDVRRLLKTCYNLRSVTLADGSISSSSTSREHICRIIRDCKHITDLTLFRGTYSRETSEYLSKAESLKVLKLVWCALPIDCTPMFPPNLEELHIPITSQLSEGEALPSHFYTSFHSKITRLYLDLKFDDFDNVLTTLKSPIFCPSLAFLLVNLSEIVPDIVKRSSHYVWHRTRDRSDAPIKLTGTDSFFQHLTDHCIDKRRMSSDNLLCKWRSEQNKVHIQTTSVAML